MNPPSSYEACLKGWEVWLGVASSGGFDNNNSKSPVALAFSIYTPRGHGPRRISPCVAVCPRCMPRIARHRSDDVCPLHAPGCQASPMDRHSNTMPGSHSIRIYPPIFINGSWCG